MYQDVINGEFNLGFVPPRMDTCVKCNKLCLSIKAPVGTAEKEQKAKELANHQKKALPGYEMKREDKQEAGMKKHDFQQNLQTPNLKHNMFYKRQLWMYNFGIHDCVADQGYTFMWEIASCLHQFLTEFNTGARYVSVISFTNLRFRKTAKGLFKTVFLASDFQDFCSAKMTNFI